MESQPLAEALRAYLGRQTKVSSSLRNILEEGIGRISAAKDALADVPQDARSLARMIDHTALKPDVTEHDIEVLCEEARRYGFATVCVNPCWVPLCASLLHDATPGVCTVIGFPLGANATRIKAEEASQAVREGAAEVDMVINVGHLRSGHLDYVFEDISAVVAASRAAGRAAVKVIIETCLLSDEEKAVACMISEAAGADFVKTSTGFSSGGATAEDIALMRRIVGTRLGVKASGGVRGHADAVRMIEQGASRIGASASVAIVEGAEGTSSY